jgi:hypothetical protein
MVPLRKGGFSIGVVARCDKRGTILGYFFGPKRLRPPGQEEITRLDPHSAVFIGLLGDLGFLKGEWKVHGSIQNWNRKKWPLPRFLRKHSLIDLTELITYSDETLQEIASTSTDAKNADRYPEDGLFGYGAVEIRLTKLLDS